MRKISIKTSNQRTICLLGKGQENINKEILFISVVLFIMTFLLPVDSHSAPATVNLNQPGVLKMLQYENPEHYRKIREILAGICNRPESRVPHWMQTKFNAHDVLYGPVLLTSLPPKKHISFTLDNTHYEALLTLTDSGPQII